MLQRWFKAKTFAVSSPNHVVQVWHYPPGHALDQETQVHWMSDATMMMGQRMGFNVQGTGVNPHKAGALTKAMKSLSKKSRKIPKFGRGKSIVKDNKIHPRIVNFKA